MGRGENRGGESWRWRGGDGNGSDVEEEQVILLGHAG